MSTWRIRRTGPLTVVLSLAAALAFGSRAGAAEITLLCSNGMQAVVEALLPQFEKATGHRVAVRFDLAANIRRQVAAGERFDVAIATPAVIDELAKEGLVASTSRTSLARVGLAIMIRQGGRRPDIGTVEAFRRALLDATSIVYAREGASGVAFAAIVETLGIAAPVKAKTLLAESGAAVAEAVTAGRAEFGVLPVSEILPVQGAEVLAPFPAGAQTYISMVGGISARAPQREAADALLRFLAAAPADAVVAKYGMERIPR